MVDEGAQEQVEQRSNPLHEQPKVSSADLRWELAAALHLGAVSTWRRLGARARRMQLRVIDNRKKL